MDSPRIRRPRIEWQTLGTAVVASSARHWFPEHEPVVERLAEAPESTARRPGASPAVSNDGNALQMDRQPSLSVDEVAGALRLRRTPTRTCDLEMTKRIQSQRRTASTRDITGALIPDQGDIAPNSVNKKIPLHAQTIS